MIGSVRGELCIKGFKKSVFYVFQRYLVIVVALNLIIFMDQ